VDVRGTVVVVTGASSGIGAGTAIAFARRGATVVLVARRLERLEELADRIERGGGRALALRCDVGDAAQLDRLPGIVEEALGPVDVIVNSAGVPGGGPFLDLSHERVEEVVRINLLSVLHATRAFVPGMRRRGRGHVVNVASIAARFAAPGTALYSATKHAVVAFSEALNYDTEPEGVLVTSVNPGFVDTEGFPQDHLPSRLVLAPTRVPEAIVKVVREGIAPEYTVPRWVAPLQVFRVVTPPLYRWGMRRVRGRARPAPPAS
jgi:short-subunit dehydrogenase